MATGTSTILFPPVVETKAPAFLRGADCILEFETPVYLQTDTITQQVVVSVSYQDTNISALDSAKHPSELMIKTFNAKLDDSGKIVPRKYYIAISPKDLEDGSFALNTYYKVQLRFISKNVSLIDSNTGKFSLSLYEANKESLSEWSKVCLIKGISKPSIHIKGLLEKDEDEENITFGSEVLDVIGYLEFENSSEQDYLKSYQVKIYSGDFNTYLDANESNSLFFDSENLFPIQTSVNEFNYTIPKNLIDGDTYTLFLFYETSEGYNNYEIRNFTIVSAAIGKIHAKIEAIPQPEFGRIKISVKNDEDISFMGNLTIRRTDATSNFTIWHDFQTICFNENVSLDFAFYDNTVEAGVPYLYCVQKRNSYGERGEIISTKNPVTCYFEDMFIVNQDKSLKIRFDQQVTSLKRNYTDVKTDTIGGAYPIIRRNGNAKYNSFQISGMITSFMDKPSFPFSFVYGTTDEGVVKEEVVDDYTPFADRDELRYGYPDFYDRFNQENNISAYNDFILEREFRKKVLDFLQEDSIKLFKTLPEGNMLVRLVDINLTPNTTLGRRIYSFSATAYEMAECTFENLEKYKCLNVGAINSLVTYTEPINSQYYKNFENGEDFVSLLNKEYSNDYFTGFMTTVAKIDYLRIEVTTEPRLINATTLTYYGDGERTTDMYVMGTLAEINGNTFIIGTDGYFEIEDVVLRSLSFPQGAAAYVDYRGEFAIIEDPGKRVLKYYQQDIVGQFKGSFNSTNFLSVELKKRYNIYTDTKFSRVYCLNGITAHAEPGTICYLKDTELGEAQRIEIGDSGILDFYNEDNILYDFYFFGKHFNLAPDRGKIKYEIVLPDEYVQESNELILKKVVTTAPQYTDEELDAIVENDLQKQLKAINDYQYKEVKMMPDGTYKLIVITDKDKLNSIRSANAVRIKQVLKEKVISSFVKETISVYNNVTNEPVVPKYNHAYYFNENGVIKRYLYHNGWYLMSENDDVEMPVEGSIDYYCEVLAGDYAL